MLRFILAASSLAIVSPALAQESNTAPATPAQQTTPAEPTAPVANTATPVDSAARAAPAPAPAPDAAPAQSTAAAQPAPATSTTQVADVVTKEFRGYDKDASGALDQTEFTAWMTALRKASEPAFDPAAPASTSWFTAAFAQADIDKNKAVTPVELTSFLTPKSS